MEFPRIIIAALRGGSGKTLLSIGITAALSKSGKSIAPFKKGPDYIDAGWLALAAGRPCYNLDSFLLNADQNLQSFLTHAGNCDISVIEGNRGLYDGIDLEGSTSTAELAKLLKCPVVLCVDCTKITRTMAAVVAGCIRFDSQVDLKGVILNRVANRRHEQKLRDSIEHYCRIPVLGAIPKLTEQLFPERHLGLVPTPEHDWANDAIDAVVNIAQDHLDLDAIVKIAGQAPALRIQRTEDRGQKVEGKEPVAENRDQAPVTSSKKPETTSQQPAASDQLALRPVPSKSRLQRDEVGSPTGEAGKPRIGVIKDSAFQFYYPENIDALAHEGAEVVFISPLKDKQVPELDALYIGGGFPETHAQQLADNTRFSDRLKSLVEDGFPIYAECGGLMYLGENLVLEGQSYPMTGILPLTFDFFKRPQGHGYTLFQVERKNPYFEVGSEIRGHEFHYSRVSNWTGDKRDLVFLMKRGVGIAGDRDGILYKNVLATYIHLHAVGTPQWARALVRQAALYKKG
ncbi:MAG: cobyrinate a,c-diamide synthase [Deltaproteobacteria bacterium]|jgi:cobyrinic acid a,c-diamide synthase|nr:cobyrinate a,c-diamide synthase [Deltaproteobacteria bacterium]